MKIGKGYWRILNKNVDFLDLKIEFVFRIRIVTSGVAGFLE